MKNLLSLFFLIFSYAWTQETTLGFCCFLVDIIYYNLGFHINASCVIERTCSRVNRSHVFSGLGSEECNPLNMSIEAELVIEQMKEQHHRELCHLRLELEDKVRPSSQSCSLISLSSDKLLHVRHSPFFFLPEQHFLYISSCIWVATRNSLPQDAFTGQGAFEGSS